MLAIGFLPLSGGQTPGDPAETADKPPVEIRYTEALAIGNLQSANLRECSGMATSLANPKIFWTHNDSGDQPRLIAFDFEGNSRGTTLVNGAKCVDWESMSALRWKGKPFLVIADMGDNNKRRAECQLYFVPDDSQPDEEPPKQLAVERTVRFTYEDGPHDCESIGFDPTTNKFILITKAWSPYCEAYELEIPFIAAKSVDTINDTNQRDGIHKAKKIGRLKLAGFTGLDISPNGLRLIGLTYADAYEFVRQPGDSWQQVFRRRPRQLALPARKQGESICYGADGQTIYTTSEGETPPLIRIKPE